MRDDRVKPETELRSAEPRSAAGTCNAVWNGTTWPRSTARGRLHGRRQRSRRSCSTESGATGSTTRQHRRPLQRRGHWVRRWATPSRSCGRLGRPHQPQPDAGRRLLQLCQACTGVRDVADFSTSGPAMSQPRPAPPKTWRGHGLRPLQPATGRSMGRSGYREPLRELHHSRQRLNWDTRAVAVVGTYGTDSGWGSTHGDPPWFASLASPPARAPAAWRGRWHGAARSTGRSTTGRVRWPAGWYSVDPAWSQRRHGGNLARTGTPDACRMLGRFQRAHGIAMRRPDRPPQARVPAGPTPAPAPTALPNRYARRRRRHRLPTATPTPITACGSTSVSGFLSFGGDLDFWPGSSGYTSAAGTQVRMLHGTSLSGPDFDLYPFAGRLDGGATWSRRRPVHRVTDDDEFITLFRHSRQLPLARLLWSSSGNYALLHYHSHP